MTSKDGSPLKVGVLFSKTGVTTVVEQTQLNAVRLAVNMINAKGGVLGRPIDLIEYDPESDPKTSARRARQLLEEDNVRTIFGCYMSSTRKAVLPVVEQYNGLLFYPTLYEGFEFSANCIYSGAAPNQNILPLARYLMREFGTDFYLVGSNYVYPYETNRIMRDFITAFGGKVHEERYIPLNPTDEEVSTVVADIARYSDTVIISTVVGDGTAAIYREHRKLGLDPVRMPIGSLTTGEAEIAAMGADIAEGHVTSAPYFQTVQTPENDTFQQMYGAAYGTDAPTSACTEAAYAQVHLFAAAAELAGAADPDAIKRALPSCPFIAPQGSVRVDSENNHTYLWPRIGKVGAEGRFEIVEESSVPIKPDPYLINPVYEDWSAKAIRA